MKRSPGRALIVVACHAALLASCVACTPSTVDDRPSFALIVIDTYEHAFYIDYHNRKAEYVEKFMDHIDWSEVNARYRAASA